MEAIEPTGANIVFGKDQKEYIPLPANYSPKTGMAITAWRLTDQELEILMKQKVLFIGISTSGAPLQPILPSVHTLCHPDQVPELPAKPEDVIEGEETDNIIPLNPEANDTNG